jgi:hypothetical protein
MPLGVVGGAAEMAEAPFDLFALGLENLKQLDRLGHDLGTDVVAGQNQDFLVHAIALS